MVTSIPKSFTEYASCLVDLHALIRAGSDEDVKGEALRDEMDRWWKKMSAGDVEQAGRLSEDLYYVHESPTVDVPFKREIWNEIQRHMSDGNWTEAIEAIRRDRGKLPIFIVAFFEGHCWAELEEWKVAKAFLQEAYRRQPNVDRIAAYLLDVSIRAGVTADDVAIANDVAARSGDPSAILKAAELIESASDQLPDPNIEQLKTAEQIARRGISLAQQGPQDEYLHRQIVRAYLGIALTNALLGNRPDAQAACRKALQLDPKNADAFMVAGLLDAEHSTLKSSELRSQVSQRLREGSGVALPAGAGASPDLLLAAN